jgi:hypothetical protein
MTILSGAKAIIDRQTEPWGVKVETVELKDAQLAESMVRGLARQARSRAGEAGEDNRHRGGVPGCAGPCQRRADHLHAARHSRSPLHADLARHGSNQNSAIVFPIPIELIRPSWRRMYPCRSRSGRMARW